MCRHTSQMQQKMFKNHGCKAGALTTLPFSHFLRAEEALWWFLTGKKKERIKCTKCRVCCEEKKSEGLKRVIHGQIRKPKQFPQWTQHPNEKNTFRFLLNPSKLLRVSYKSPQKLQLAFFTEVPEVSKSSCSPAQKAAQWGGVRLWEQQNKSSEEYLCVVLGIIKKNQQILFSRWQSLKLIRAWISEQWQSAGRQSTGYNSESNQKENDAHWLKME